MKRCTWGTCKSDTRYPDRLKKADGTVVSFYSFPNAKKASERREIWIRACCRGEKFVCTKVAIKFLSVVCFVFHCWSHFADVKIHALIPQVRCRCHSAIL